MALNRDKTLKWDIGSDGSKAGRWTRLEAFVEVPESCDRIYLRFGGNGIVTAWVDDVAFVPFQRQNRSKPKVLGYAAQRVRERMDRGLLAVRKGPAENSILVGGSLQNDPEGTSHSTSIVAAARRSIGSTRNPFARPPILSTTRLAPLPLTTPPISFAPW